MSNAFLLKAEAREDIGKGASRRLRHQGKIPAVIYGGDEAPQSVTLLHSDILKCLNDDTFYSQLIDIEVAGKKEETILRDLQRHPYKPTILHADFQRVVRGQELTLNVPVNYINIEDAKGVKAGGILSQNLIDVEITCRPSLIPEAIEVDVIDLDMNESLYLSDLTLPEGVRLTSFDEEDEETNLVIVSIHPPKAEKVEEEVSTDDADDADAAEEKAPAADEGDSE